MPHGEDSLAPDVRAHEIDKELEEEAEPEPVRGALPIGHDVLPHVLGQLEDDDFGPEAQSGWDIILSVVDVSTGFPARSR